MQELTNSSSTSARSQTTSRLALLARLFPFPAVPPLAPRPRLQPGVRQHVHQDLVGSHPLHKEGGKEGEEEGRRKGWGGGVSPDMVLGGEKQTSWDSKTLETWKVHVGFLMLLLGTRAEPNTIGSTLLLFWFTSVLWGGRGGGASKASSE